MLTASQVYAALPNGMLIAWDILSQRVLKEINTQAPITDMVKMKGISTLLLLVDCLLILVACIDCSCQWYKCLRLSEQPG